MESPHSLDVSFERGDCASFGLRLLVDLVDTLVVVLLSVGAVFMLVKAVPSVIAVAAIWFLYFALLKYFGATVGYLACGLKLLNIDGSRPAFWVVVFRCFFSFFGPLISFLIDLTWLTGDPQRQALRDKLSGTLVVKKSAVPLGRGTIACVSYTIMAWRFLFQEVEFQARRESLLL